MGNVLIPRSLLERIIELFEWLDLSDNPNQHDYFDALWELKVKMQKIELREAYTKIIIADDDDSRHDARIEYLQQRGRLGKFSVGGP